MTIKRKILKTKDTKEQIMKDMLDFLISLESDPIRIEELKEAKRNIK